MALLQRGAVNPTDTTAAAAVSHQIVADFVGHLGPISAAASLIRLAGLRPSMAGASSLLIPERSGLPAGDVSWIAQGASIPTRKSTLSTIQLGPLKKMAAIVPLTREVLQSPGGQAVMETLIGDDVAASLDATMFSSNAATAARPAGLLNGLTALTSATGPTATETMLADLGNLAAAVAAAGGTGRPVFVMATRQAAAAALRLGADKAVTILPTAALPTGTVVAVEPLAFATAFGPDPRIEASIETTIVMDDSAPGAFSAAGTPNTVAAPIRSAWQTDSIMLRVILDTAWAMRSPGMVAVVNGVAWG